MVFHVYTKAVVPVTRCLSRTGKNPSLEDAAGQMCCNGRAVCAGGLGLGCWGDSTPGWDHRWKLEKIRWTKPRTESRGSDQSSLFFVFRAELALCCIIPHESSCQGDADLQRLQSLLTDGNLSLKLCQSLWMLHPLPSILRLSCHALLSALFPLLPHFFMLSKVQAWSPQPPTRLVFLAKVLRVPYLSLPALETRRLQSRP